MDLSDENDRSKVEKAKNDVKSGQNENTQGVRRSDRKRTQRFAINQMK